MIYSLRADRPHFKSIAFKPGFNVILAERTKESKIKDSRNGLGKSTLIEILHFCLGANKGETLGKPEMNDWTFTLDLDLAGKKCSVSRNTSQQNRIVVDCDFSKWPVQPQKDKKTGEPVISQRDWNRVLGVLMFGLQPSYPELNYAPTFRSLISYFVRRNSQRGGFLNPFQQYKNQKEWDKQINNAFLLDLGWEYASKWQVLKDRVTVIDQIKQEAKAGILSNLLGTVGELEALKIRMGSQVSQEEEQLNSFNVHPQYRDIQEEVNDFTARIHQLVNDNIVDKRLLDHYEQSLKEETEANPESVTRMFEEAGLVFPDTVKKHLGDVLSFHKQVVINRKDFLKSEMDRLRQNIEYRSGEVEKLSTTRGEKMRILQKHGALEEYTQLQNNHQGTVAELEEVKIRLENMKKFEQGKNAVTIEQALLQQQANTDLNERKAQRERAILLFNDNSKALYEAPGTLSIDVSKTGYKYNVTIERSGSHGISNMKIFCYDLILTQIWTQKPQSPGFLVHDSIIFADVDERQKALALELAAKESEKRGFQYICTLNSDAIPTKDFSKEFNFEKHVRQIFTDATQDGGLLGIRF
jgi:uncharacterized protein YydD (DUF2326 family)